MSNVLLNSLVKRFADTVAVDNLSMEIESGSFVTFLGPSGCGKTTTLRMLAGFLEPDEGDILINGRSQRNVPPDKRPTSIVFQDYAIFPHMTVFQNVAYGLRSKRVPKDEIAKRVEKTLDLLGMSGLGNRYSNQLSGGQQQRVALARSLILEPEVLLMDEPLSNLDAKLRTSVSHELKHLQKQLGITTIYVTHDQTEALSMSDKIAILNKGKIEQYDSPHEIYYNPKTPFVADFMGEANFIDANILELTGDSYELAFGENRKVKVPKSINPNLSANQRVKVMIRPEALELRDSSNDGYDAIVKESMFLGNIIRYWLEIDGETLITNMRISPNDKILSGSVKVNFDPSWLSIFPA